MWWESSDCLMSNSAISSHWHTGSGLRRSTSRMRTRSGSESALATAATRSASSAGSSPTAGAQHCGGGGAWGSMGSKEVITMIVAMTTIADPDTHINNFQYEVAGVERYRVVLRRRSEGSHG